MKKFIVLSALLSVSAFAVAGVANTAGFNGAPTDKNVVVKVYNADGVAHENGDVVEYVYNSSYGLAIATTTSASSKAVAGIVYPDTIPANTFGTILIYGYHPAITIGVANSAGDCLGTSTTAEATGLTTTADACVAVALEATTSSTTVKGFVRAQ